MRKIVASMFMAMDGVVENPHCGLFNLGMKNHKNINSMSFLPVMHSFWGASPIKNLQPDGLVLLVHMVRE